MQLIMMAASFFLVLLAFFLLMSSGVSVAIHLGNWNFLTLKFEFCQENILFSLVLMIIVLSVLAYSMFYMEGELYFSYYGFMTLLFVTSMLGLNFSGNTLLALLSWDLLGISSFFLILYYNNWESCNGAMSTIMTNRLGDFFLFAFFASMFMSDASFWAISNFHLLVPMLLVLGCMTKSAQFPFSSWLPKAMSAPTPISSLVHSSTLVTAGLLLLMKFSEVLYTSFMMTFLSCVGLLTMLFASLAALVEQDLKKVVALSTLSQMGFAFMTLGMGMVGLTQLHLVSHALFKSCLFMQIGYLIHISMGQQDPRGMMGVCETVPVVVQLQTVATLFCLTGLFFLSGAVSKDMILERGLSSTYSIAFFVIYVLAIFLTFCYSLKLWNGFLSVFGGTCYVYSTSLLMNYLALPLVLLSIGFIWWVSQNMLVMPKVLLYGERLLPLLFVFVLLILVGFAYKGVFKLLLYKVGCDHFSNKLVGVSWNFKFVETSLNSLFVSLLNLMIFASQKSQSLFVNQGSVISMLIVLLIFMV